MFSLQLTPINKFGCMCCAWNCSLWNVWEVLRHNSKRVGHQGHHCHFQALSTNLPIRIESPTKIPYFHTSIHVLSPLFPVYVCQMCKIKLCKISSLIVPDNRLPHSAEFPIIINMVTCTLSTVDQSSRIGERQQKAINQCHFRDPERLVTEQNASILMLRNLWRLSGMHYIWEIWRPFRTRTPL